MVLRGVAAAVVAIFLAVGSAEASGSYAPVLSRSGLTLTWTATAPQGHYYLEAKPGGTTKVDATTYTPKAQPGQTVAYRVRPGRCACWSNEVSIPFPSEEKEPPKEEPPPPVNNAGVVKYRLNAKSAYDQYAGNTSFLKEHIDRVLCYVPFCDSHYLPYVPVVAYHDAYTKCGAGNLNPSCRATYVAEVERDVRAGYVGANGQFMDDVEWSGSGQHIAGTDEEMAQLIEAVRRAMPNGVLELNTQYSDLKSRLNNPYVMRALAVTNHIDKEFGVNSSSGISSPTSFAEYLAYVDALHGKGIHIDQADSTPGNVYEVGTYLLSNDGYDYIGSAITPETWNALYDTNLGSALGSREVVSGVYRRRFAGGVVYVDPPGGPSVTVDGHALSARQGIISK